MGRVGAKTAISAVLHRAYTKNFSCKPVVLVKAYVNTLKWYLFGVSTHQISTTNTPNPQKLGFWKFILFTISEVKIFVEFNGEIIFQISAKLGRCHFKNLSAPGLLERRKWTATLVLYTMDLRSVSGKHKCLGSVLCCHETVRKFLT